MSDFSQLEKLLGEARNILTKSAYTEGGVTAVASMSGQLGEPSSTVMLTDGAKKRKKNRLGTKNNGS